MSRLPLFTIVFLCSAILLWNFSFYPLNGQELRERRTDSVATEVASPVDHDSPRMEALPVFHGLEAPLLPAAYRDDGSSLVHANEEGTLQREPLDDEGRVASGADEALEGEADSRLVYEIQCYPSGAKKAEGYRRDEKLEGLWTEWWENGMVAVEGCYEADKRAGEWRHSYESGQAKERGRREDVGPLSAHPVGSQVLGDLDLHLRALPGFEFFHRHLQLPLRVFTIHISFRRDVT